MNQTLKPRARPTFNGLWRVRFPDDKQWEFYGSNLADALAHAHAFRLGKQTSR